MAGSNESGDNKTKIDICRKRDSIFRDKGDGTLVNYYLYPECEIHYNSIRPGTVQSWHHHSVIAEIIYVVSGNLEARWRDDGDARSEHLSAGDTVSFGVLPHTLANLSSETAEIIVFKMVPEGIDKRSIFEEDKCIDPPSEARST